MPLVVVAIGVGGRGTKVLLSQMRKGGIEFVTGVAYDRVERLAGDSIAIHYTTTAEDGTATSSVAECDALLVATGRRPNVAGQGLEAAGVEYDLRTGVKVDDYLRTTNPDMYVCVYTWC